MVKVPVYDGLYPKVGEELVCPICLKIFKATTETRYIRKGKHVCSWACFLNKEVTPQVDAPKIIEQKAKQLVEKRKKRTTTVEVEKPVVDVVPTVTSTSSSKVSLF